MAPPLTGAGRRSDGSASLIMATTARADPPSDFSVLPGAAARRGGAAPAPAAPSGPDGEAEAAGNGPDDDAASNLCVLPGAAAHAALLAGKAYADEVVAEGAYSDADPARSACARARADAVLTGMMREQRGKQRVAAVSDRAASDSDDEAGDPSEPGGADGPAGAAPPGDANNDDARGAEGGWAGRLGSTRAGERGQQRANGRRKKLKLLGVSLSMVLRTTCYAAGVAAYMVAGAFAMRGFELDNERAQAAELAARVSAWQARVSALSDAVASTGSSALEEALEEVLEPLRADDLCAYQDALLVADQAGSDEYVNWDFVGSLWFVFTVVTTIGYGTYTPQTTGGQVFTTVYMYIFIPLTIFFIAQLAQLIHAIFLAAASLVLIARQTLRHWMGQLTPRLARAGERWGLGGRRRTRQDVQEEDAARGLEGMSYDLGADDHAPPARGDGADPAGGLIRGGVLALARRRPAPPELTRKGHSRRRSNKAPAESPFDAKHIAIKRRWDDEVDDAMAMMESMAARERRRRREEGRRRASSRGRGSDGGRPPPESASRTGARAAAVADAIAAASSGANAAGGSDTTRADLRGRAAVAAGELARSAGNANGVPVAEYATLNGWGGASERASFTSESASEGAWAGDAVRKYFAFPPYATGGSHVLTGERESGSLNFDKFRQEYKDDTRAYVASASGSSSGSSASSDGDGSGTDGTLSGGDDPSSAALPGGDPDGRLGPRRMLPRRAEIEVPQRTVARATGGLAAAKAVLLPPGVDYAESQIKAARDTWRFRVLQIAVYVTVYFVIVLLFAMTVALQLGWDYWTAFYFSSVTFTTVGFGDFVIVDGSTMLNAGQVIGYIIFIFTGLAALASLIGLVIDYLDYVRRRRTAERHFYIASRKTREQVHKARQGTARRSARRARLARRGGRRRRRARALHHRQE